MIRIVLLFDCSKLEIFHIDHVNFFIDKLFFGTKFIFRVEAEWEPLNFFSSPISTTQNVNEVQSNLQNAWLFTFT